MDLVSDLPRTLLSTPEPADTLLPDDLPVRALLAAGTDPGEVAARFPAVSAAWAALAAAALADGRTIEGYAFARVGYHRGLDSLRRSGWRGHGPVPWSHEPNRGFLTCLALLARASAAIGEADEPQRCEQFLADCDPRAVAALA
jgi:hypothetical protein